MRRVLITAAVLAASCTGQDEGLAPNPAPTPTTGLDLILIPADEATTTTAAPTTTVPPTTTTLAPVTTTATSRPQPAKNLQPVATTPPVESSTTWAIPTYIVMCESGGDWNAYNPSGASGPYQLMPMHFNGELAMNQSRAAQHAKAAELWNGGRGRSHWAACL